MTGGAFCAVCGGAIGGAIGGAAGYATDLAGSVIKQSFER